MDKPTDKQTNGPFPRPPTLQYGRVHAIYHTIELKVHVKFSNSLSLKKIYQLIRVVGFFIARLFA